MKSMVVCELYIEYGAYSLDRPFTYVYLKSKKIFKGARVKVPFNNSLLVGYVIDVKTTNKSKEQLEEDLGFKLNEIEDVIDEKPILNDDLLELGDKISEYYLASKINVLSTMLPPSLKMKTSSLNKPKIAYDQYLRVIDRTEDDLTPKQIEMLRLISSTDMVLKRELGSISIVNKLLEKNKIEIVKIEKKRLKIKDYGEDKPISLSKEQEEVKNKFIEGNKLCYLLQGVTGSGKTEVYLSLSEYYLKQKKTVLVLVPEISLTPMMCERFLRKFKGNVAILHSALTPAEKYDEYRRIANGEVNIVVGARSAIFAPLKNIGLIVLDEEHAETYKQDNSPYYHAREVALLRASMHHAKVLLGSATPSLETRAKAEKGIYGYLRLDKRVFSTNMPTTTIVNMLDYANIDRNSSIFSIRLRKEITATLSRGEQVILLLNRRGFSTSLQCRKCGYVFKCPECGLPLTYHKYDKMLKCHHCGHVELVPDTCPNCDSKYLMKTGFGSERVEDEIKRLFPSARTLRLDSDTARLKNKISSTIESFKKGEADILIGTQMIAKGHDFPNVTLVGVVLADIGLTLPNFRSVERTFELLTQAIGRSGRSIKKGQAIIQTYQPTHYAVTMAARQNYDLFFKTEMKMRKLQELPPFTFVSKISVLGKNEEALQSFGEEIAEFLKSELPKNCLVLGPVEPYFKKEGQNFKRIITIKYKNRKEIRKTLKELLKIKSNFSLYIDIDPYEV